MISYTFLKTNFVKFPFSVIGAIITRTLLAALTKKKKKNISKINFRVYQILKLHILFALHLLMIKKTSK